MRPRFLNIRISLLLLPLAGLSLLYSCDGCSDKNPSSPSSGQANLSITIKMPESYIQKSSVKGQSISGVTNIRVTLTSQNRIFSRDFSPDSAVVLVFVEPGQWWNIDVTVFTEEGLSFTGSANIYVPPGGLEYVSIPVDVNRPPVIERMWADSTSLRPGESTAVHIRASDRDGDSLSYSCGGPDFTWTAPSPGSYVISCTVKDGHGGSATASITIDVVNRNPVITGISPASGVIGAGCPLSVTVTVSAYDPDGDTLSYQWAATGGTFTGSGASVIYNHPCYSTETVTVTVIDNNGGSSSVSVNYTGL